ncbi:hypothetical protein V5799_033397 [Amblyomma americanum]|uniref:Uncharacterized protein n=1 Tax=Amblyomma americanum TaxID=6943 RepID=A0AAQ4DNF4_AMBAM
MAANTSTTATDALSRSGAVMFLRELYSSCEITLIAKPKRDSKGRKVHLYYAQMAAALLDEEKHFLAHLTTKNLLAFLLTSSLKYRIHSVVAIDYKSSDETTLLVDHDVLSWNTYNFPECVSAALTAHSRNKTRSDYQQGASFTPPTLEDVRKFSTRLHELYPYVLKTERFVSANMSRLWPAETFAEALRTLPWIDSGGVINILSRSAEQIAVFVREITERKNWEVGAVYLVAHMVARAYLDVPDIVSEQNVRPVCLKFVTRLQHTVNTAYWDLYGTPEKQLAIVKSFNSVRDVVAFEAASSLVSNEDQEADRKLSNLTSTLTLTTAASRNIRVGEIPAAVPANFGRNLLLGLASEFKVRRNRASLGLPLDLSEESPVLHTSRRLYLEVPASFYR